MPSRVAKNEPKTTQNGPKRPQDDPKKRPKATQNDPKSDLRGIKKRTQAAKRKKDRTKTIPRKTVLDRPPADLHSEAAPPGLHLGGQNGTEIDPRTIKNRSENSRRKKGDPRRSWTHLGAILGRSWPHLGVILGQKPLENTMFCEKHLFRR